MESGPVREPESVGEVTRLLGAWQAGDDQARDRLVSLLYSELRRAAAALLNQERPGQTLQPTALVHEVFLRMVGGAAVPAENRRHFLALASRQMRQVLINRARDRIAAKRQGGAITISWNDSLGDGALDFEKLDDALTDLEKQDRRKCQMIELRHFGGLTSEEIAACMNISSSTVERSMRLAYAWLYRYLSQRRS